MENTVNSKVATKKNTMPSNVQIAKKFSVLSIGTSLATQLHKIRRCRPFLNKSRKRSEYVPFPIAVKVKAFRSVMAATDISVFNIVSKINTIALRYNKFCNRSKNGQIRYKAFRIE